MTFWQLTVPTSPETSDGLTNFLWEHGALGVVEEEFPREPPRLRAFFPHTASSTGLIGKSMRSPSGFAPTSPTTSRYVSIQCCCRAH